MLIWNEKEGGHTVRIKGKELCQLKKTDFPAIQTVEKNAEDIKTKVDLVSKNEGYHLYCYVFANANELTAKTANYVFWLGSLDQEPEKEWWLGNP